MYGYTNQRAANRYHETEIQTASPTRLVVLLLEGAVREIERARFAIERNHRAATGEAFSRAIGIVGELRAALDMERGGELAERLDALYDYALRALTQANLSRDPKDLEPVKTVLSELLEGFRIAFSEEPPCRAA